MPEATPANPPHTGARPQGAADEQAAALAVRAMFDEIAPRYDLLNHVLSLNIDRLWWSRTARRLRPVLARPEAAILDICCGTGDMTLALLKHRPARGKPILAADFSHPMLVRGARKFRARDVLANRAAAVAIEADAMHLPVRDRSLDLITTAFGFRNLANYRDALGEFYRVLAPGGQLAILDFAEPGGPFGRAYSFYFRRILPAIGARLSGASGAYTYLPSSVHAFPPPAALLATMREVGFTRPSWKPYTFGIAGLYIAMRE